MAPTLIPGDEFVVSDTRRPAAGNIVTLPHPKRPDLWLVKRLAATAGDTVITDKGLLTLQGAEAWVLSDNDTAPGAQDSRSFGVVDLGQMRPLVTELDEETFAEGVELLCDEDPALAGTVEEFGVPRFWRRPPGFRTLVLLILEQQVSLESGAAVFSRLRELVGEVTPRQVALHDEEELQGIGFTRQKAGYITGLAEAITASEIDLDEISRMHDQDASAELQKIRGIGQWTADAYLLSAEGRPDVFPVGDRALQVGAGEVLGMGQAPDPGELEMLAEPWKPIRAVAARIIWHAYLSRRGRVEPDH